MSDSNIHQLPTLDKLLGERIRIAAAAPGRSDWADVERRARSQVRRPPRRRRAGYLAIAAVVAGVAAIAAPALGLPQTIVAFFSAEPAPANVVRLFSEMNDRGGTGAAAGEAKLVHVFDLPSGRYALSVTPTERGSFCWNFAGFTAGCQTITSAEGPFKPGEVDPVRIGLTFRDIPAPSMPQEPVLVAGNLRTSSTTDELRIEFEDGAEEAILYVWVSAPIEAGFFLYELPKERWADGKRPTALALYQQDGTIRSRVTFAVTSSLES